MVTWDYSDSWSKGGEASVVLWQLECIESYKESYVSREDEAYWC